MIFPACAWDRNNPWLLRQKPCECDLSSCRLVFFCKLFEQINHRSICCDGFNRESWELSPKVFFGVQLRVSIDFPGQITLSKWSPGDEADPQLLASLEYAVLFWVSRPNRVLTLNCCDRLHSMRSADCSRTGLGETEVQDLALGDQIFYRT